MKARLSFHMVPLVLVCLACAWVSQASARLHPPCQEIAPPQVDTGVPSITYDIQDPISGVVQSETWSGEYGDERYIESVRLDEGILTWIYRYKSSGDASYSYQVHLRIYDPGRGGWRSDHWALLGHLASAGYNTSLGQHQVKHGVVAWTAHRKLADGRLEHKVVTATYDPWFGSWVTDERAWQVPWNSLQRPADLLVKNGVVACVMYNWAGGLSNACDVPLYYTIYDYELHQWMPVYSRTAICDWNPAGMDCYFDWIDIPDDLAVVRTQFWEPVWIIWEISQSHAYYDPYSHQWLGGFWKRTAPEGGWEPYSRAYSLAQPAHGEVPKRVWFWDCSTGLDGVSGDSSWSWQVSPGGETRAVPSPTFFFSTPGEYSAVETVHREGYESKIYDYKFIAEPHVPPSGGIGINSNDQYTTSANVTLGLNYSYTATEMCFRQSPGLATWGSWEPVARSKAWTLSTLHEAGGTSDGVHTVYVKFRDQTLTESAPSQDSITLAVTPPVGALTLNNGSATTTSPTVSATWSATTDYPPMQTSYCHYNAEDAFYGWSPWESYQPATRIFQFSSELGKKTVMVRFKDPAGNITQREASVELISPNSADLSLSMTDSPDPVNAGTNLTYSFTVTNGGPYGVASAALTDTLPAGLTFVSASSSQGSCAEYRGRVKCSLGSLASGGSATASLVVIPSAVGSIANTAYVDSPTRDPNPGNNSATQSTTVVGASKPDLVVSAFSEPPANAMPGSSFALTDTVTNQGSASAGASMTACYLSLDATKSSGDIALLGSRSVGALPAGGSSTGDTTFMVPNSTPEGSYFLLVCADAQGAVSESVESNNCLPFLRQVVVAAGFPDLVGVSLSEPPESVMPGGEFQVTYEVMNQGSALADYSTASYYLSRDATKSPDDALIGSLEVFGLGPMNGTWDTVTVTVPTLTRPEQYLLLACADDLGVVLESNETNNCLVSNGYVSVNGGPPDLIESSVYTLTTTVPPGGALQVNDTVVNIGTGMASNTTTRYYLSLHAARGPGDVLLEGAASVGPLSPGAGVQNTMGLTIPPSTTRGSYYILACADDYGSVSESDETNNCAAFPILVGWQKVLLPFLPILLQ